MEQRVYRWLGELPFTDLTVTEDPREARYKRVADDLELQRIPEAFWGDLKKLYADLRANGRERFGHLWAYGDRSVSLRVQRNTTTTSVVFMARQISKKLIPLEKLGMSRAVLNRLRSPQLVSGGVIFCGRPSSGKTTAACSLMIDRLINIGGFTWAAENPVEYHLHEILKQAPHSKGQCHQTEIDSDADYSHALSNTLRNSANTFYVGEIRERTAAETACLAAKSGILVLSTIHANNLKEAITKLGYLAGFDVLADALSAMIGVRLEHRPGGSESGPLKILHVDPLFVESESTRMMIREKNMAGLTQVIANQEGKLLMESRTTRRG